MAITRSQQAKQMLQDGGMLVKPGFGGTRQGYRGPGEYQSGKSDPATGAGSKDRNGRDPRKQFESVRPTNIVDEVALTSSANKNFMRDARDAVTPIGDRLFRNVPFSGGIIGGLAKGALNLFSPSPFGFSSPKPVDFSGMDRGGDVPYWAQLGYSSEAEYLAALARAQAPSTTEQETEEEPFQLARRFRADGGPIGGEYDFESARQMYGLGKLVKKITRSVKKIAKSPIGKAALLYAGGSYLSGTGMFGGLKGAGIFSKAKLFGAPKSMIAGPIQGLLGTGSSGTMGILGKLGLTKGAGSMALTGKGIASVIGGTSLLAGLLTPEQEEEAQSLSRGEGIDIEAARRSILNAGTAQDFRARRFVAEGGSMKEPVAKKTMPLLDLKGQEMDLRAEGGFVPIGRMEKADDVPARLSKNEFVFTADAVRNAGDGDVDKGAEVMYNMMKNLEAGGDVSEESQGLEGARKMFQTSQRLEEVL